MHVRLMAAAAAVSMAWAASASAVTTDFTASGPDAASIQATVDNFRNALGPLNAPAGVNHPDGRREINWDAAPDAISDPNPFPGGFFNTNFAPRARGMTFTTNGSELRLSSTAASGTPVEFGEPNEFDTFSPERLLGILDGNILDVHFRNPVIPSQRAVVDGFGAVFTGNQLSGFTFMEFFDLNDVKVHEVIAPNAGNEGLAFAGSTFDKAEIARVRIYAGTLGVNQCGQEGGVSLDCVAMDDFIAGEIQPVPVPPAIALMGAAIAGMGYLGRRARKA